MRNDQGLNIEVIAFGEVARDAMMVMDCIEKGFKHKTVRNDVEIADELNGALHINPLIQADKIALEVINGWVFVHGDPQRNYQDDLVKRVVINVAGVRGYTNKKNVL